MRQGRATDGSHQAHHPGRDPCRERGERVAGDDRPCWPTSATATSTITRNGDAEGVLGRQRPGGTVRVLRRGSGPSRHPRERALRSASARLLHAIEKVMGSSSSSWGTGASTGSIRDRIGTQRSPNPNPRCTVQRRRQRSDDQSKHQLPGGDGHQGSLGVGSMREYPTRLEHRIERLPSTRPTSPSPTDRAWRSATPAASHVSGVEERNDEWPASARE